MRRTAVPALALAIAALLAVSQASAATTAKVPTYTVHLTGSQDVPKGSPTGKGTFRYQLLTSTGQLCYSLTWSGIDKPFAAHIHKAGRGKEGAALIPLSVKAPVAHSGCVTVKKALLEAIKKHPSAYYVNVHTKKYPGGAVRAQLG